MNFSGIDTSTRGRPCSCVLCGGMKFLLRPSLMVSTTRNCAEMAIDLCDTHDNVCFSALKMYNTSCCTLEEATHFYERIEEEKYSEIRYGGYSTCWLCSKINRKPTIKSMVINILSLQPGTCIQYYHYGRLGYIQPHLCSALQALAKVPCGC